MRSMPGTSYRLYNHVVADFLSQDDLRHIIRYRLCLSLYQEGT